MKTKLIDEKVYSPVNDTDIKTNLNDSPIWKNAYKHEELTTDVLNKFPKGMFEYTIRIFDTISPKNRSIVCTY